ncbi:MAG: tRNA guanosine(34) transglycosylase Tgt [Pseudomonadota bacterium]
MRSVQFSLEATTGGARAGRLLLPHGEVRTPVFMPVGTQAALRATQPRDVHEAGVSIMLANTYHLSQRPGEQVVQKAGGLHRFMGIDLPMLTDSGGFQVFSLDKQVDEDGVTFRYEVDGQRTRLTPERSMAIQQALGADIAMIFDECLPWGVDRAYAEASLARTHRWEARSKAAHTREDQALFGIVQGAFWPDLRKHSAEEVAAIGFDGYAIGGLAVGEEPHVMLGVLEATTPHMPRDRPRYLMGVGRPQDLVEGVARGVDMFDCVIPTRHARSGLLYTDAGRIRMTDRRYRRDFFPIDTACDCATCRQFTRAYVHHLFRVGEILAATLATIHNVRWFVHTMERMRQSILDGTFEEFRARINASYPETGGGEPAEEEEAPATASARPPRQERRRRR